MEEIILVGYGGHAVSVADCIERQKEYKIVGYTDIHRYNSKYEYLGTDDNLKYYHEQGVKNAAICIGYIGKGDIRQRLYDQLKMIGYVLPIVQDPSAIISESAAIGEGSFIGKGAVVNAEARVGKMCIINTKAVVEHECQIEDFAHVAVGTVLCGRVYVGQSAFIGANSTVIQCMKVQAGTIVPAGEVIRKITKFQQSPVK